MAGADETTSSTHQPINDQLTMVPLLTGDTPLTTDFQSKGKEEAATEIVQLQLTVEKLQIQVLEMQQRIRFLDQSGTMGQEKRGLELSADGEERGSNAKRQKAPALASVTMEALMVDIVPKLCSSLEPVLVSKLCSSLEPVIHRVVSVEVERALAKLGPARLGIRSPSKRIEGPDGSNLQLHFRSRLSLPLFTGGKVEGEQGAAIHVVLLDANTGHVVTSGPESSAKLDVVVLEGDFNNEDDWTDEDFESHVVKEREGKRPLLIGDLQVSLKEGVGTLGELTFTDNSSWIRSRKFRLGLKIASGFCVGIRIRKAKTGPFAVKDHRSEWNKKHYPPALKDDVWRLEKIGKDGSFHKRLNKAGIYTVEDFLRLVLSDAQKLRNFLGSGMSNKMWESLVEHAKTCVLLNFNQNKQTTTSENEVPSAQANNSASYDQQVSQASLSVSVLPDQSLIDAGVTVGGGVISSSYSGNQSAQYFTQTEHVAPNAQLQYESSTYNLQNQFMDSSQQAQITRNDGKLQNAKTCVLSEKYYVYYSDDTRNFGARFNSIHEFVGFISGGQYYPAESLSESLKVFVDTLVKEAYDDWTNVIEYDGEALLNFMQSKQTTRNEVPPAQANYSASYDQQQVSQASLSVSVPSDQSLIDAGVTVGGGVISSSYGGNQSAQYFTQTEHVAPNAQLQYESSTYNLQNQFIDLHDDDIRMMICELQENEDNRMMIRELQENEDMHHLCHVLSMGSAANLPEDEFSFPSSTPSPCTNYNFCEDSNRKSRKAGWLKIKFTMRWGICFRKKAAERRAQLAELDE
ncbi:CALMODULIN-BINDING PROTEIN60 [Dioscorea alata]|uniref:CALMODULIN-BINDING PROTEIN60 n=1 Tax=Dioscorea alata TaxID=55571 RepID=A0ACB7VDA4_DIOAL|nr:CALMODULIN-BINDING PROTEIN60 [Dioscorea alata]